MSDGNSKAALSWYKACARLADNMNATEREEYTTALIENVKFSSDDYFRNSQRPLASMSVIQRELGDVVETLLYPPQLFAQLSGKHKPKATQPLVNSYNPMRMDYASLVKGIWVVGILTLILTVVTLFIMCLYCVQYKKMRERKKMGKCSQERGLDYCQAADCICVRRIWDTGEPRKKKKSKMVESDETDDSDKGRGLKFSTVHSKGTKRDQSLTRKMSNREHVKRPREPRKQRGAEVPQANQ